MLIKEYEGHKPNLHPTVRVAENAVIGKNCVIGKRPEDMENRDDWGVAVVGPDCKLSEGTVVAPKEMIDKEAQA